MQGERSREKAKPQRPRAEEKNLGTENLKDELKIQTSLVDEALQKKLNSEKTDDKLKISGSTTQDEAVSENKNLVIEKSKQAPKTEESTIARAVHQENLHTEESRDKSKVLGPAINGEAPPKNKNLPVEKSADTLEVEESTIRKTLHQKKLHTEEINDQSRLALSLVVDALVLPTKKELFAEGSSSRLNVQPPAVKEAVVMSQKKAETHKPRSRSTPQMPAVDEAILAQKRTENDKPRRKSTSHMPAVDEVLPTQKKPRAEKSKSKLKIQIPALDDEFLRHRPRDRVKVQTPTVEEAYNLLIQKRVQSERSRDKLRAHRRH